MARPTTIKDALKRWEDRNKLDASEGKDIGLQFQMPPIEKMDNTLSSLTACEKLSLSTNGIGKIVGLNGLKNLKVLSLSRNFIKTLNGIEALADCLEQLWISYNFIEKLRGIENMKTLRVLYITHNFINEWNEVGYLKQLPMLEHLNFLGNPLVEDLDESVYVSEMTTRLPKLRTLDDEVIIREEDLL